MKHRQAAQLRAHDHTNIKVLVMVLVLAAMMLKIMMATMINIIQQNMVLLLKTLPLNEAPESVASLKEAVLASHPSNTAPYALT